MTYTILQPTCYDEVWLTPALGFDVAKATATVYGAGHHRISWISAHDVARFAVAALEAPRAANSVIKLGGPEALSPLDVVQLAERITARTFAVQHVPESGLRAQYEAAADPMARSFAGLMLYLRCRRRDRHGRAVAAVPGAAAPIRLRTPAVQRAPVRPSCIAVPGL
jgi:NADH dehydrogenase